ERPAEDNDVRPPQRTDFPHFGAVLAHCRPAPRGLPGYVAVPELAVRSSTRGEFKRVRSLLRGGGGGFLRPPVAPPAVNGEPGTRDGVPALSPPENVSAERLERRAALLSVLDSRGPTPPGARVRAELREQAVALTGASGGAARPFSLDG